MAAADLYAAFLRTVIWSNGHLDALQQDMCIKNYLFLSTVAGAYYNFQNTSKKEWCAFPAVPCFARNACALTKSLSYHGTGMRASCWTIPVR